MHVEFDVPDHAALIERLLEGFFRAGELLVRAGAVGPPSLDIVLQDDDVPRWQLPTETAEKGTADCEDLVIAWVSWLRGSGKDPHARARIKNTGPKQVHCLLLLGDGRLVDVYQEHLDAQAKRAPYAMGGFWSTIKHAASSVGHGVSSAAHAVGHGVSTAAGAVGDAAHYVAHDLPGKIIHEGASGLSDLAGAVGGGLADVVHGVGGAVSNVVNSAGDVVAGGLGDALHQVGKLGGAVGRSFGSDDSGGDGGAPDTGQQMMLPPGGDADPSGGYGGYAPDDGDDDPFAGVDTDNGASGGWLDDE